MKKLIFLLLLALPFFGFSQAAYLMEFTNPNGSKVVFNLNDVRSCVAEGTGSYLFTRTGSGKTQVQESPATIALNSCGNIVLFTVYSPLNQYNTTKQMGVNPNYVVGVVSNTSGNGVLKMVTPTENFTTTGDYDAAVSALSICVSGGGGGGSLTNTYVGFGDGLNQLDGEAGFTYDAEANRLAVDTVKTKRISSKSGQLELLNDTKFNAYPNTRNDAGVPVNVLTTSATGIMESHPVRDLRDSLAELVSAATLPTTAAYKVSNKWLVINTTDTTELTYIGGNKWRADIIKGASEPPISVSSGSQIIDYSNALWKRSGLAIPGVTILFSYQNGEWQPAKGLLDIDDFGGRGDNSFDNALAFELYTTYCKTTQKRFVLRKGIYKTTRQVDLSFIPNVEGRGATIKRWDFAGTAGLLAANYTSGNLTITVTDGSKFKIGQAVNVATGPNDGQHNAIGGSATILNIAGNVITLSSGFSSSYTAGAATLITNYRLVYFNNTSFIDTIKCVVDNVVFDGNYFNAYNYSWSINHNIEIVSTDLVFTNCRFQNIPNENIDASNKIEIHNCTGANANGSFIHFSSQPDYAKTTNSILLNQLKLDNFNIKSAAEAGHSEALFTVSAECRFIKIKNVSAKKGGKFIFAIGNETTESISIEDCEFENFKGIMYVSLGRRYQLINNRFKTCGDLVFYSTNGNIKSDSTALGQITISGNYFENAKLIFNNTNGVSLVENTFYTYPKYWFSSYPINSHASGYRDAQISFIGNQYNVKVSRNHLEKSQWISTSYAGLLVETTNSSGTSNSFVNDFLLSENMEISDNVVKGYAFGIYTGGNLGNSVFYGKSKVYRGLNVHDNTIYSIDSVAYTTGFYLLKTTPGGIYKDNKIYQLTSSAPTGHFGIYAIGSDGATKEGSQVVNNFVFHNNALRCQLFCDFSSSYNMKVVSNDIGNNTCTDTTGNNNKNQFASFDGLMNAWLTSGNKPPGDITLGTLNANSINFYAANQIRMHMNKNGGIIMGGGQTNPSAFLDIINDSYSEQLMVKNATKPTIRYSKGGLNFVTGINPTTNNFVITQNYTQDATVPIIEFGSGKVYIGASAGSFKFNLVGTAGLSGLTAKGVGHSKLLWIDPTTKEVAEGAVPALKYPLQIQVVDGNTEVPGAGLQNYEVIRIPACYNGYSISDVSYGVWKTGATGTAEMQIRRNGSGTAGVTFTAGQAVKDVTLTGVTVSTGDLIDVEIISNSMATPQQGLWVTIFLTPN